MAENPDVFYRAYGKGRLFCTDKSEDWRDIPGLRCVSASFIPPDLPFQGNAYGNPIWEAFRDELLGHRLRFCSRWLYAVDPDQALYDQFEMLERRKIVISQNRIRARHGKPSKPAPSVWIERLLEAKYPEPWIVAKLLMHSSFVVLETLDGWLVFDGNIRAFEDVLEPLARLYGADIIRKPQSKMPVY